jgi:ABC-2 type transport system permease protein
MQAPFANISLGNAILVLLGFAIAALLVIQPLLRRRFA